MLQPTPEQFRGLARSSPWRWRTLAFDLHRRPLHGPDHTLRAVVERGVGVEVHLADGGRQVQHAQRTSVAWYGEVPGHQGVSELPFAWELPLGVDADGFVRRRPSYPGTSDDPMWQDYEFVARLDPVELADGVRHDPAPGWDPDAARPPALDLHRLDAVPRHGRDTWVAEVSPREDYSPRCSCCPLLFGVVSDALVAREGGPTAASRNPQLRYPTRHLVALDVATGVCVSVEHLDGDAAGRGFSMRIRSVEPGP